MAPCEIGATMVYRPPARAPSPSAPASTGPATGPLNRPSRSGGLGEPSGLGGRLEPRLGPRGAQLVVAARARVDVGEDLVGLQRAGHELAAAAREEADHLVDRAHRARHEDVEARHLQRRDDLGRHLLGPDALDAAGLAEAGRQLGAHDGGHDSGDVDRGVAQLAADRLADADDEVLRAPVRGAARLTGLARRRPAVDQVAAVARGAALYGALT